MLLPVHTMAPLLEVEDLQVAYRLGNGRECEAVSQLSFQIEAGETIGVLGESGSGKSTLAAAILRLLPPDGSVQKGAVRFEGRDLMQAQPAELQKIRGGRVGIIFQEPSRALHPALRVGEQLGEVVNAHLALSRSAGREKTRQVLESVFPEGAARIANSYPHQLSGGQKQRVLLAQAIACDPPLLIADEPTASLDPSTQLEILELLKALQQRLRLALLFITHNPLILSELADRVMVLYAGRIAEIGPTRRVLSSPRHPYTAALLRCVPPWIGTDSFAPKSKLPVIPEETARVAGLANGCRFEPRCPERMEVCAKREPGQTLLDSNHAVFCFKHGG